MERRRSMKLNILIASLALSALSFNVVSCSSAGTSATGGNSATKTAITAAKNARKSAKKVGFEWRDMGKLIKKAEAAAKAGKSKKAIQIANKVVRQGQQAQLQAKLAMTAGPRF